MIDENDDQVRLVQCRRKKRKKAKKITKLTKWQKHFNLNLTRNNIAL